MSSQTIAKLCQLEEEEEGVTTVSVTNNMTEHQVMEKILQRTLRQ